MSLSSTKAIAARNISLLDENIKVYPQHWGKPMINYGSKEKIAQWKMIKNSLPATKRQKISLWSPQFSHH